MAQNEGPRSQRHLAATSGGEAGTDREPLCGRGGRSPLYARDGDADDGVCGHCRAVRDRVFAAQLGPDEGRTAA